MRKKKVMITMTTMATVRVMRMLMIMMIMIMVVLMPVGCPKYFSVTLQVGNYPGRALSFRAKSRPQQSFLSAVR